MAYIVIQDWMISDLQLKGNELLTYALIYGFSQDGESEFKGSLKYISEFLGISKSTAQRSIEKLVDRGIVEKRVEEISGVKFNRYMAHEKADTPIVKTSTGYSQNDHGGIVKMTTNNTNIYNTNNNTSNNTKDKGAPARYFDDEELNNKFLEFLSMRKKIRKPVRTDRGMQTLIAKLRFLSKDDVEMMKRIIDQSLDNEWQGLFSLNGKGGNIDSRLYDKVREWAKKKEQEEREEQKEQEGGGMYDDFGVF
nr:MAG TPA: helix-turn-helix domain protein [Caudoviricetes sp.]